MKTGSIVPESQADELAAILAALAALAPPADRPVQLKRSRWRAAARDYETESV
jgi:hypothetical protein